MSTPWSRARQVNLRDTPTTHHLPPSGLAHIHYRSLVWSSPVMPPSHSRTGLGQTSYMALNCLCLCDSIPPRLYPAFRLNLGSTACALSQSILSVWDTELTKKKMSTCSVHSYRITNKPTSPIQMFFNENYLCEPRATECLINFF